MNISIPAQCKAVNDEVEAVKSDIQDLQDELANAVGSEKAPIGQQLHLKYAQLAVVQKALDSCLEQAHVPLPLNATFTGAYTVNTTFPKAKGPFSGAVTIGCHFSADRTQVTNTSFPSISVGPISIPVVGSDMVTVTQTGRGSGSFTPDTGAMSMLIVLLFHHSLKIPFYQADSTLSLIMETGTNTSPSGALTAIGSPMDAQGMIVLAGVGIFSGGYLAGYEASTVLAGQIAPHP